MDRKIALAVCFGFGLVMFAQYFSDTLLAHSLRQGIAEYWQIVFAFALLVGIAGYVQNNLKKVTRGEERSYRTVGLLGFLAMPVLAIFWGIRADSPFMWMFENVQTPMQSTVFALLAFFVASASYRGFRARSASATLLLIAALIMLLSRSAVGGWISSWLPDVADWIRNNAAMSARRAILIGIGLGSLTTALRVILGIERTWLGGAK
ncbi:MAG TPA: hypothetical protein PLF13_05940 [candidate division Zixibacteria bacterium]|nr:hypothetical protein [candidate division Zixibacteria bacterium]